MVNLIMFPVALGKGWFLSTHHATIPLIVNTSSQDPELLGGRIR